MIRNLAAFALILISVLALQFASGAYHNEIGGHPDEPAHLVSGLMIEDYLSNLAPRPPMEFAEDYYLHYPKVAIGNWPPVFYLLEGAWTLVTTPSRVSVLLLMALVTSLLAFTLFRLAQPEFGTLAALALALLLAAFPDVQYQTSHVMTDNMCALFCLWAAILFARYLEAPSAGRAILWGAGASLAIMTKGSALALAYVPPLAVLLTRRFGLLRRISFWLPAALVILVCGPWYWWTLSMSRSNWTGGRELWNPTLLIYAGMLGPALALLAAIGLGERLFRAIRTPEASAKWAVLAALLCGWLLFHTIYVPGASPRKSIGALVPGLLFFAGGLLWIARALPLRSPSLRTRIVLAAVAAAGVFFAVNFRVPRKICDGHAAVAESIVSDPALDGTAILASSPGHGEGALIAEIALRRPAPRHLVLRASKFSASSDWNGRDYKARFASVEAFERALSEVPVSTLVLDITAGLPPPAHHRQLLELVASQPDRWRHIGDYPLAMPHPSPDDRIAVYRRAQGPAPWHGEIRLDLKRMLGREIVGAVAP